MCIIVASYSQRMVVIFVTLMFSTGLCIIEASSIDDLVLVSPNVARYGPFRDWWVFAHLVEQVCIVVRRKIQESEAEKPRLQRQRC